MATPTSTSTQIVPFLCSHACFLGSGAIPGNLCLVYPQAVRSRVNTRRNLATIAFVTRLIPNRERSRDRVTACTAYFDPFDPRTRYRQVSFVHSRGHRAPSSPCFRRVAIVLYVGIIPLLTDLANSRIFLNLPRVGSEKHTSIEPGYYEIAIGRPSMSHICVAIEWLGARVHDIPIFSGHNVNQELFAVSLESRFRYVEEAESTAAMTAGFFPLWKACNYSAQCFFRHAQQFHQDLYICGRGLHAPAGVLKCSGHRGVELGLGDHLCRVNTVRVTVRTIKAVNTKRWTHVVILSRGRQCAECDGRFWSDVDWGMSVDNYREIWQWKFGAQHPLNRSKQDEVDSSPGVDWLEVICLEKSPEESEKLGWNGPQWKIWRPISIEQGQIRKKSTHAQEWIA
ncbi:hypothetical protein B0H13DRAFT_1894659 [Mycena leptocephala]|nr:hypothetical protein B0H13DRAFT_1894659 [Mycena leptocephala]